jgi:transcriptional regulator with XRE-family HTH domain
LNTRKEYIDLATFIENADISIYNRIQQPVFHVIFKEEMFSADLKESIRNNHKSSINTLLSKYEIKHKLTATSICKRASISDSMYNRTKRGKGTKDTIFKIAIGLHLAIDQVSELLDAAGYSFNNSDIRDMIITFCIINKKYDFADINDLLSEYGQRLLIKPIDDEY